MCLQPLPGQAVGSCSQELATAISMLGGFRSQFVAVVTERNDKKAGQIAHEMANTLGTVVTATRGLVACTEDAERRQLVLSAALHALELTDALFATSKLLLDQLQSADEAGGLLDAAKLLSKALRRLLDCLPGHAEYERALQALYRACQAVQSRRVSSGMSLHL